MNEIALPAFHVTTTRDVSVRVDHRLGQDLRLYRQYYKQAYGAEVTEADLIREMARRFMESDRQFHGFKNQQVAGTGRKGRKAAIPLATKITTSSVDVSSTATN
jgi:hypothetical protein